MGQYHDDTLLVLDIRQLYDSTKKYLLSAIPFYRPIPVTVYLKMFTNRIRLHHFKLEALVAVAGVSLVAKGNSQIQKQQQLKQHDKCKTFCESSAISDQNVSSSSSSSSSNPSNIQETKNNIPPTSKPGPKILFLGSGSSTGCPKPLCSLLFPPSFMSNHTSESSTLTKLQNEIGHKCKVSNIASIGNPIHNKNYRNNPSLLISHANDYQQHEQKEQPSNDIEYKNVIIDVGKTFRETALRWMPLHSIYNVDAIVLTHEHADAMLGLDDLRGFQKRPHMYKKSNNQKNPSGKDKEQHSSLPLFRPLPIYLSNECFQRVKQQFDYLVPKHLRSDNESNESKNCFCDDPNRNQKPIVKRAVASLDYKIIEHFEPFDAAGLKMIPLPVMHGEDLICNGYAFSVVHHSTDSNYNSKKNMTTREKTNVVYLSDISRMIPETEEFILQKLPPTDILIIDSLMMKGTHPVHFSLEQALEIVKRFNPKQTYIVGINCDDFPEHDEANKLLQTMHPNVQLAYDGLVIELS